MRYEQFRCIQSKGNVTVSRLLDHLSTKNACRFDASMIG